MIQPYPGKRPIPTEGLVLYDWYAGKGQLFDRDYTFGLSGLEDRLIQLSPIVKGWAVIGRTDKYLSAAAVHILEINKRAVTIKMTEAGPLTVWSKQGVPKADGLQFKDAGNGLSEALVCQAACALSGCPKFAGIKCGEMVKHRRFMADKDNDGVR